MNINKKRCGYLILAALLTCIIFHIFSAAHLFTHRHDKVNIERDEIRTLIQELPGTYDDLVSMVPNVDLHNLSTVLNVDLRGTGQNHSRFNS